MRKGIPKEIIELFTYIFISPREVFESIKKNKRLEAVYAVFITGALITFLKSFLLKKKIISFSYSDSLNNALSWLSIPQITWFILYLGYFVFIYCVFKICKIYNKQAQLKPLMLSLMSISGIGVFVQIIFFIFKFIFAQNIILISSYLIYFWIVALSLLAIRITQNISLFKAIVSFLIISLPFIFLMRLAVVSPYLAWLSI